MTQPLRAVLFDYGHTLIAYERPEAALLDAYAQLNHLLTGRLQREVPSAKDLVQGISVSVDEEIARGYAAERLEEVEIAALYEGSLRRLGLELEPAVVEEVMEMEQKAWLEGIRLGPDVVPTLERIRAHGLGIGLVSNASYRPRLMRAQLDHLGVTEYFDSLTWSSEVGVRKPHPAIYADALRKLGVAAAASLFVGDRVKEDVQGPQSLGMKAVLLREWRQEDDPDGRADYTIGRLGDLWPVVARLAREGAAADTYN